MNPEPSDSVIRISREEATSGHDAEIKARAGQTASVVDEHLKMARDIQKEIAAKPTN